MGYAAGVEEAVCLGLIHGLTEFLPLSSDAHVALAETLLDVGVGTEAGYDAERLALHACLRAGSLLAGLVYFRRRIASAVSGLGRSLLAGRLPGPSAPGGELPWIAVATLPTALLGVLLRPAVERWQGRPLAIGFGLILSALWLTSSLWTRAGTRTTSSWLGAALVGVAQGLAWFPGLSRSAANLTTLLWLGLRPERAFELAMLTALPALAGALGLQLWSAQPLAGSTLSLLTAALIAFGAGLFSLFALRRLVQRGYLAWCALWLLPVALASLALAKAWPG